MFSKKSFWLPVFWAKLGGWIHYGVNKCFGPDLNLIQEINGLKRSLEEKQARIQQLEQSIKNLDGLEQKLQEMTEAEEAFIAFRQAAIDFLTGYRDFRTRASATKNFVVFLEQALDLTAEEKEKIYQTDPTKARRRLRKFVITLLKLKKFSPGQ